MRVLFINSANSKDFEIPSFIRAQADSLKEAGIEVEFFRISGHGFKGYFKKIGELKRHLRNNNYDVLHAHYSLSAWVAVLAFPRIPIVMSLMGTDAYGEYTGENKIELKSRLITLLTFLIQPFVNAIISKSENIEKYVYRKKISHIIPNGVSLERFKPATNAYRKELGLEEQKQYVLFLGDYNYCRKNFELAKKAVELLNDMNAGLIAPYPVPPEMVPRYLNAADVLIVTAFIEGSSNVIKEAMACNCPVVTTEAGDAKWVIGNTEGCFLTSFKSEDVAHKLQLALDFARNNGKTKGRERIIELGLDSATTAEKIIRVYSKALHSN